jgi:DNA repair protein RecO (recombination protein O)
MLRRTEGIVLRTFPFGEADLIVTYLTPEFGILKLFAKSPRKIKSRFGSSLEPLTCSKISFWGKEDAALPKLTQSDIIHPFHSIRNNLHCFLKVSEILELTVNFIPERDANERVYSLFLTTLQTIETLITEYSGRERERMTDLWLVVTHYKVRFLERAGFAPRLDACGRCGKQGYSFYLSEGSILCESCARATDKAIKLSPPVLRLYADLLAWDTTKVRRIKPSNVILGELSEVITMHINYTLSKPLKSEAFVHVTQG